MKLVLDCLLCALSLANTVSENNGVRDNFVGIHGMVIFQVADKLVASHMPLHNSMHAHQLRIEVTPVEIHNRHRLAKQLDAHSLITLKPEAFSLSELRSGKLSQFSATVVAGPYLAAGDIPQGSRLCRCRRQNQSLEL